MSSAPGLAAPQRTNGTAPEVPSPTRPPRQPDIGDVGRLRRMLVQFRARRGIDAVSPKRLLSSAIRVGRADGVTAVLGSDQPQALVSRIWHAAITRHRYFTRRLIEEAAMPAAANAEARREVPGAKAAVGRLEKEKRRSAAQVQAAQARVDRLDAARPDPSAPLAPTREELEDEQADAEPLNIATLRTKLPLRVLEVTLDFVTYYPLLAAAGLGSVILGVWGSHLLVLAMAAGASIAVPVVAYRLGGMSVEGSLRDARGAGHAWFWFGVLLAVAMIVSVARFSQVLAREFGTVFGALGLFGISALMLAIIGLEFLLGRRSAQGRIVAARRVVAAEQRRRRQHPEPRPEGAEHAVARDQLERAERAHAGVQAALSAARDRLGRAERAIETTTVELREIRDESRRMTDEEDAWGRVVVGEALQARRSEIARHAPELARAGRIDSELIAAIELLVAWDPFCLLLPDGDEDSSA